MNTKPRNSSDESMPKELMKQMVKALKAIDYTVKTQDDRPLEVSLANIEGHCEVLKKFMDSMLSLHNKLAIATEAIKKYIGDDTAQGWDAKTNEPLNHFEMVNDFREVLAKIAALSEEKKK